MIEIIAIICGPALGILPLKIFYQRVQAEVLAWKAEQKSNRKKRAESRLSQSLDDALANVPPTETCVTAPAPSSGTSEQEMSSEDTKNQESPSEMIVDETD